MITRFPQTKDGHLTWPADRFYWAVLEAPGMRSRQAGPLPPGLLADLAEEVPEGIDELHAVGAPLRVDSGDTLLVCAARRADLIDLPPHIVSVTPAEAPAGLDADTPTLAALNLLVGDFEPVSTRRERTRRHLLGLGTLVLVSAIVAVGLARRGAHNGADAREARASAGRVVAASLPAGLPPEALAAEVARLKQASRATAQIKPVPDAALALAALLRAWPASAACKPQSIAVTEGGMTLSVLVEGDARPFLQAFVPPAGWAMDEPRVNSADKFVRIAIDLKPMGASPGGRP